ncbi:MAG: hypothetical protein R3F42_08960 [Pseudomonadota bacterium]
MPPHSVENACIHISGNSGYSRHGDTISLYAERIDNLNNSGITSGNLALQLWGCQGPYNGGALTGWKLAELNLGTLQANHFIAPVRSDVPANFPEHGDYAIALVIAEWDGEDFNLIHDFQNYANRDVFLHPCLEGRVSYRVTADGHLAVEVERIHNPREPENVSGTLSLELWALSEPYHGGVFSGHAVAGITLETLQGGTSWSNCAHKLAIAPPPPGTYALVLMLREWTGNGYVTRDYFNFNGRETFPLAISPRPSGVAARTNSVPEVARKPASSQKAVTTVSITGSKPPSQAGAERTATTRKAEDSMVAVRIAELMGYARRVLEKIRQQLSS